MIRQGAVASLVSRKGHPSTSFAFWLQITRIKEKVEEQSGVPPPQQRLIFGGRQMYVVDLGNTLFLILSF